ncbi:helix-turn-helix domain-containing protein [Eggerthella timonensis]|uniref:helix-turn-helix domain-containing protein n=1 Tax=Eggerthella timonensis TaxID=1871008 RepID=UPI000C77EBE2|nr:helix-turn-helix transcriptional regulator [Eggerthella timonensis]
MEHAKLVVVRMEEARELRGISVAELARRASIDRKRLWYILDGQRQMRADEFVRLCVVLNLGLGNFLTSEMARELTRRR